jgi:hypothetical protein
MPEQKSYRDWLREDLGATIEALGLTELQTRCLRSRWLDQLLWMEGAAARASRWYHSLRVLMIVGGILVPALISLNLSPGGVTPEDPLRIAASWAGFVLGLVVAICAAVEEFFKFGERWRHYRRTAELLKIEGWQFFQLSGSYHRYDTHQEAFSAFAASVEALFGQEVEAYISQIAREKEKEEDKRSNDRVAKPRQPSEIAPIT